MSNYRRGDAGCVPELFDVPTAAVVCNYTGDLDAVWAALIDVADVNGDADAVRLCAADPACPGAVLATLAERVPVEHLVALNPSCPTSVLRALAAAERSNNITRLAVAANPSCPNDVLEQLAEGFDVGVAEAARITLEVRQLTAELGAV